MTEGRLHPFTPVLGSVPVVRGLYLAPDVHRLVVGPWTSLQEQTRARRLQADLEQFVSGEVVSICLMPYEARTASMGRLDPPKDGVWDFRSRDPKPALRVFGRFAARDTFVAICWRPRSKDWGARRAMGNRRSMEWHFEILECHKQWNALFSDCQPVLGDDVDEYFSANVISF